LNALVITRLRVAAFITTLATMFIGAGARPVMSGTKMVFFNDQILTLGRTSFLAFPTPSGPSRWSSPLLSSCCGRRRSGGRSMPWG